MISRPTALALGIGGGLVILLLVAQLVILEQSREDISSQEALAQQTYEQVAPVARVAAPLVRGAAEAGEEIDRLDLPGLAQSTDHLVAGLRGADLPGLARSSARLVGGLDAVDLPDVVRRTDSLVSQALASGLVERLARSSDEVPVAVALLAEVLEVQRETRRIQDVVEDLQRRSLHVQLRSLEVQRRSLRHVRSLDRKTGGEFPPTSRTTSP